VKNALIAGIGNVLLGDDAAGPYVVRLLEALYKFGNNVEVADLGTPALDLTHRISGLNTVILVDSVASHDDPPGTVLLYAESDIVGEGPSERLDPHSPALSECLMAAEMLGFSPENVLLVGIVGERYEPGEPLSSAVQQSIGAAIDAILQKLEQHGFEFEKRALPIEPGIWWCDADFASIASC